MRFLLLIRGAGEDDEVVARPDPELVGAVGGEPEG